MALIICTECGRQFSTLAAACPGCGAPTESLLDAAATVEPPPLIGVEAPELPSQEPVRSPEEAKRPSIRILYLFLWILLAAVLLFAMFGPEPNKTGNASGLTAAPGAAMGLKSNNELRENSIAFYLESLEDGSKAVDQRLNFAKTLILQYPDSAAAARARELIPELNLATSGDTSPSPAPATAATIPDSGLCKAAISALMHRDVSIMRARAGEGGWVVSYVRTDDGTQWQFKCRVDGSQIQWGSNPGRWRADERLSYSVSGNGDSATLSITRHYSDGSRNTTTFPASKVK